MKNRLFYPAVFHKAEEGGFWVSFPDFPECMTQGDSMDEAYEMAIDALGLSLSSIEDEGTDIPKASEFETVDPEDGILVIIEFDMAEYRRKHRSKAVKKTLSIPEWLNEAAIRENLNFSQILQEALMMKLGVNGRQRSYVSKMFLSPLCIIKSLDVPQDQMQSYESDNHKQLQSLPGYM